MKNRAIIFDIDGTAIDSPREKLPSPELIKAIRIARTKYFVSSATGRVWSFAKPILQALKLTDPCVISAGTQICDPVTGNILWQKTIDPAALERVITVLKRYPDWKLLHNDGTEDDYFHGGVFPQDFACPDPVYFLEQVFVPDNRAQEVHEQLNTIPNTTCVMVTSQRPGCRDLHVIHKTATKEHAVMELLRLLGVRKEDTIAIGDGHNDIHLFEAVGHRVAMGNAIPELKAVSDQVIGSITHNGLATYLNSLK